MELKIAPQPWRIGQDSYVYDASGHFVTTSGFHFTVAGGSYIPARLNTAFIVKAVNTHADLLWALGEAIEWIKALDQQDNTCNKKADIESICNILAAAEGK